MNKNKSIRLKSWLNTKLQAIREEEGFTLIELIVVMAIIAVLVLLAAPNFMGKIQEARVTGIQNDVAVAEDKVSEKLINHDWVELEFDRKWGDVESSEYIDDDKGYLESIRDSDDTLYGKEGIITPMNDPNGNPVVEISEGDYKVIPDEFISVEIRSSLDGTFITNLDGTVYYVDKDVELKTVEVGHSGGDTNPEDGTPGENIPEPTVPVDPNMYEVATDSDFTKTYNSYVGDSWMYTGDAEYVIIPEVIQGEPVWNYVRMFQNSNVKGVSNISGDGVLVTTNMFQGATSPDLDISGLKLPDVEWARGMFHGTSVTSVDLSSMNTTNLSTEGPNTYYDGIAHDTIFGSSNITSVKASTVNDAEYMYISTMNQDKLDKIAVIVDNIVVPKPDGYFEDVWVGDMMNDYSAMGDDIEWGYHLDFDEDLGYMPWVVDDSVDKRDTNNYKWVGSGDEYASEYWVEVYGDDWEQMSSDSYYKWAGPLLPNYDDEYGQFSPAWYWN